MAAENLLTSLMNKLGEMAVTEVQLHLGLVEDINFIKGELAMMKAFLERIHKVCGMDKVLGEWVSQIRDESFKIEDILEEFRLRMKIIASKRTETLFNIKACFFYMPYMFKKWKLQHQFHYQVKNIKKEVRDISNRKDQFQFHAQQLYSTRTREEGHGVEMIENIKASAPFFEESDIVGIDGCVKTLEELALGRTDTGRDFRVISIVGMGGIGKTTLAKRVYNIVKSKFQYHAWICVSPSFDAKEILSLIAREIVGDLGHGDSSRSSLSSLQQVISNHLCGRRYLLILDDIWDLKAWEIVRIALPLQGGCKVIFTTRDKGVAAPLDDTHYIYKIKGLPFKEARDLFCRKAFGLHNSTTSPHSLSGGACPSGILHVYVDEMVRKCDGLPLALVTLGGLMSKHGSSNISRWKNVLDNMNWEFNHSRELEKVKTVLLTSYNYLPSNLQSCFLYCGMFPEDFEIFRSDLVWMWVAEGFVLDHHQHHGKNPEEVADAYFMELVERNMIQGIISERTFEVNGCRMHDMMREMAIQIMNKEKFAVVIERKDDRNRSRGRRLALHCKENVISNEQQLLIASSAEAKIGESKVRLHSLHVFGESFHFNKIELRGLRFLRVLNLSYNVKIPMKSSEAIGELIHLRYLAFGKITFEGTSKCHVIKGICLFSLQKLHNLQTLDLFHSNVFSHLFFRRLTLLQNICHFVGPVLEPIEMPKGLRRLKHLQTLARVKFSNVGVLRELASLAQLRILYIEDVRGGDYCEQLCECLKHLQQLRKLGVTTCKNEKLQLGKLLPPNLIHLEDLCINGVLDDDDDGLPDRIASHPCLRILDLHRCKLKEDPLHLIKFNSPSITTLRLFDAYAGRKMLCFGSCSSRSEEAFPNLKYLRLEEMPKLEGLDIIENGSMRSLQVLEIIDCKSLKKLPYGIQHLTTLQKLKLSSMPTAFCKRYKEGGEDHWMVQNVPIREFYLKD